MAEECNAVFKGGGAKGIAYAGALQACEEAGITFRAVAGSSAGAITAALVACGYSARETADLMPEVLGRIDSPGWAAAKLWRSSLLSPDDLREWLERRIAARVSPADAPTESPTFADVRAATGVTLYVVTMDLGSRQPIVFSPDLTPGMPVADAVIASSAIPVAFPPQRVAAGDGIHRLVDGGTWANYPDFVFRDEDFRAVHELDDGADARRTIGFVLDEHEPTDPTSHHELRPVRGPRLHSDRGSAIHAFGTLGAVVTSPIFRLAALVLPSALFVLGLTWLRSEVERGFPTVTWAPNQFEDLILVTMISTLAIGVGFTVLVSIVVLRLGRDVADIGLTGAAAALGVGPNVPYWVGSRRDPDDDVDHVAVRIVVPEQLGTLNFRPGPNLAAEAVAAGHLATVETLRATRRSSGTLPPPTVPTPEVRPPDDAPTLASALAAVAKLPLRMLAWIVKHTWAWVIVTIFAIEIIAYLCFEVLDAFVAGQVPWAELVGVGIAGTFVLWSLAARRDNRSGPASNWLRRQRFGVLLTLGVVAALFGVGFGLSTLGTGDQLTAAITANRLSGTIVGVEVSPDADLLEVDLRRNSVVRAALADLDPNHRAIERCGEYCLLVIMEPGTQAQIGQPARVDPDREVVSMFADTELEDLAWETGAGLALTYFMLATALACWRASRWRRQHLAADRVRWAPPAADDPSAS